MRKRTMVLAAALAAPMASWAAGPDWSYLDGSLVRDGELEQPGVGEVGSNGLDLEASVGFGELLFLQAALEGGDVDAGIDMAYDRFAIGPGLTTDIELGGTVVAPWIRVNYRRDNFGPLRFDGYGAAAGVRWHLSPRVEAELSGEYGEVERGVGGATGDAEIEDTTYELALRYAVSPRWMVTAAYRTSELEDVDGVLGGTAGVEADYDRLLFGARWNYAADPGALAGGEEGIAADSDNYMDALYVFGDEIETRTGGTDDSVDIEGGALVRGSAALTDHLIVQGSVLNTGVDAGGSDELAADWYSVGPGLSFTDSVGAGEMDLYSVLSYERADIAGDLFDGGGVTLGARYRIAGFELAPAVKLFSTSSDGGADLDGQQYGLDVLYAVSPAVSLVANATHIDGEVDVSGPDTDIEQTVYGAGLRFYYGGKS